VRRWCAARCDSLFAATRRADAAALRWIATIRELRMSIGTTIRGGGPALGRLGLQAMLAALALLLVLPARAQVDEALAERLMRGSGLWQQLGSTAAGARAGIEAAVAGRRSDLEPDELERLLAATDAAFAPQALRASVVRALAARLQAAHAEALNTWFDSAAGRRVTALELAATAPERDSGA
jgi:hypothetical protein